MVPLGHNAPEARSCGWVSASVLVNDEEALSFVFELKEGWRTLRCRANHHESRMTGNRCTGLSGDHLRGGGTRRLQERRKNSEVCVSS